MRHIAGRKYEKTQTPDKITRHNPQNTKKHKPVQEQKRISGAGQDGVIHTSNGLLKPIVRSASLDNLTVARKPP